MHQGYTIVIPVLYKVCKKNSDYKLKLISVTNSVVNKPWIEQIAIPNE